MGRVWPIGLAIVILLAPVPSPGAFQDVTLDAFGILPQDMPGWSSVQWPDYDGDGWPDLHLGADALFRNNGDGSFTLTTGLGLGVEHGVEYRATWADADNDGDLDCAQSSWGATTPDTVHKAYYFESGGPPDFAFDRYSYYECPLNTRTGNPLFFDGDGDGFYEIYQATFGNWAPDYGRARDRYFEADGGESWSDVTDLHFPDLLNTQYERHSRGIVACDWNLDLFADIGLYVTVTGVDWSDPSWENILWGDGGDGVFDDLAAEWGVAVEPHGVYGIGLANGASWGDYDRDGDFDLVVANSQGWTALYRHDGLAGSFSNVTEEAGLYTASVADWHNTAWADLDNDGDLDLVVTTWGEGSAVLYENEGGHFHDATQDFGFDPLGSFQGIQGGVGAADYDRDGDLDLCFTSGVGQSQGRRLFRNDSDPANHWLVIRLEGNGTSCARTAAGAQVRLITPSGPSAVKQVENSSADACQHMHAVHFGLGAEEQVDWIEVRWPTSPIQEAELWSWQDIGQSVDQWIVLEQGTGSPVTSVDAPLYPGGLAIEGLYPNPARETATCILRSLAPGAARVSLYDVAGRKIREAATPVSPAGPTPLQISVTDLPAGIYFLRAAQGQAQASAKLFVLH